MLGFTHLFDDSSEVFGFRCFDEGDDDLFLFPTAPSVPAGVEVAVSRLSWFR